MSTSANEDVRTSMPYVTLGKSGLKISRLILGCMSYGSTEWEPWTVGEDVAIEHIKTAYSLGINAFDTADVYSNGESEAILGRAIRKLGLNRDELVILTKVCPSFAHYPKINST